MVYVADIANTINVTSKKVSEIAREKLSIELTLGYLQATVE